jgi:hypothetical protein
VTEEIKTRQTAERTTSAVESGQRADTGSAHFGNPIGRIRPYP